MEAPTDLRRNDLEPTRSRALSVNSTTSICWGFSERQLVRPCSCTYWHVETLFVFLGQLSLLPSAGREISSSLWVTGWSPCVADWGGGMSASCYRGSNCSLTRAMDGRIVRGGIISACQSAASSEIVKRFWSRWLA